MKNLFRLPELRNAAGPIVILTFFVNFAFLALPFYLWNIFDRVLVSRSTETLLLLTLIAVFVLVLGQVVDALRSRLIRRYALLLESRMVDDLQSSIVGYTLAGKSAGIIFTRLDSLVRLFKGSALTSLADTFFVPLYILAFFIMNWILGTLMLGLCIFAIVVFTYVSIQVGLHQAATQKLMLSLQMLRNSLVRSADIAAANGFMSNLFGRFQSIQSKNGMENLDSLDRAGDLTQVIRGMSIVAMVLVSGTVALLIINDLATPGLLFAANMMVMRMMSPLQGLASSVNDITDAADAADFLAPMTSAEKREEGYLSGPVKYVQVTDLTFAFPNAKPLFQRLNARIEAGSITIIHGASGTGKTTLLKLLAGIARPTRGDVSINGFNAFDLPDKDRQSIGYLPQAPSFFTGTIEDNINHFGDSHDVAVKAAKIVQIHDEIRNLPLSYDTELDDAEKFSGGQKQKLSLARVMAYQPSLLILDEPTTYLDDETVTYLLSLLTHMRDGGRTIVVASHDRRMLQIADTVLELTPQSLERRVLKSIKHQTAKLVSDSNLERSNG